MPPSIISISSDSDSDLDSEDDHVPFSTRTPSYGGPAAVSLLEAGGDDDMDWEASPPTEDKEPESNVPVQLPLHSGRNGADGHQQPTLVSTVESDDADIAETGMFLGQPLVQSGEQSLVNDTSPQPQEQPQRACSPRPWESSAYRLGLISVELPKSTLVNPRSSFEGFVPPAEEITEHRFMQLIGRATHQNTNDDYIEVDLDNFSVYADSANYGVELRSLQALGTQGNNTLYVDGQVRLDDQAFFLRKVPFCVLPIGGYDNETKTVREHIWIHSVLNQKQRQEVYYCLKNPAPEYERFLTPFLWIADLAKHFINFCDRARAIGKRVVLADLKHRFHAYIKAKYSNSAIVTAWCAANRTTDFRVAIVASSEYIWKEAHGVSKDPAWHTIWKEIRTFDAYQPNLYGSPQLLTHAGTTIEKTSVTQYIYRLFEHFDFGRVLNPIPLASAVQTARSQQVFRNSRQTQTIRTRAMRCSSTERASFITHIQPGDVLSTYMDNPDFTSTDWKLEPSVHHEDHHVWMARVQAIHVHPTSGTRSFDVLWLYHPRDTSCGRMKYPWKKELFLSDNCTCHPKGKRLKEDEVLATHEVEWHGDELTTAEFFVRQIYFPSQNRWERLRALHFDCSFYEEAIQDLRIGDTVLGPGANIGNDNGGLQPLLIESLEVDGQGKRWANARKFTSVVETGNQEKRSVRNELCCSTETVNIRTSRFQRRCYVRLVEENEIVSTPYNLGGTGDMYFIRKTMDNAIILARLRQGFDPAQSKSQLRGFDLFCGGGNFGRGLEEGGAVTMHWSNDIWSKAIHTYMANNDGTCQPYLGSVDDLLQNVIEGVSGVPAPGDVDFISGGSPCPGFSRLTNDKTTPQQQKNRSLCASFASFVDCVRPKFGLLENVKGIVESKQKDSCVLSQLICALVGLGYQTQLMWLDAWSFGAPQSRERVFLCFAAPGFAMPRMPEPSHSHPPWVKMTSLGKMSNGLPYGQRENVKTPFKFVTASAATADLPSVADGKPDFCIGYPDHRLAVGFTALLRRQLSAVPMRPYGLNFREIAFSQNGEEPILPPSQLHIFGPQRGSEVDSKRERASATSKGWGRVHPHGLFSTVTTACQPADARSGTWSHWSQNRPLTLLEVRRAQGFHDDEVILGTPGEQWKVVGNSVSRHVAVVLGLAIREAWYGTLLDEQTETGAHHMGDQ